jgi:hypothetical protein
VRAVTRIGAFLLLNIYKMKKSFILHIDTLAVLDELTDEQAGLLFKAIKSYQMGLNNELDFALRMAFLPFELQFKRDAANYEKTCEKNRENGSKGGRPKKPTESQETQSVILKPKKADSDNDSDSDSDNDNKKNMEKQPIRQPKIDINGFVILD